MHAFLKHRRWRRINDEEAICGMTWVELLSMYDVFNYRSRRDRVEPKEAAVARAATRSKRRVNRRRTFCTRASLFEELRRLKEAVRYVAEKDLQRDQQDLSRRRRASI